MNEFLVFKGKTGLIDGKGAIKMIYNVAKYNPNGQDKWEVNF